GPARTASPDAGARRIVMAMGRVAHIPYAVGQDEDGVWCAHAYVGRVGCNGNGDTREEALADLRDAVVMVLEDDGAPEEFAIMVDVA
ncbi:hypothetical protein, partial [Frankia sp. Cr1]|uniref:type II toxin-antitoxin system HicB family antitoxin n=1 Tax=Frankia sp. Cr1 TaxID=3073931 RepID=UPI002AD5822B